jgi:hypothetical protein
MLTLRRVHEGDLVMWLDGLTVRVGLVPIRCVVPTPSPPPVSRCQKVPITPNAPRAPPERSVRAAV